MQLQAVRGWPGRVNMEQTLLYPAREIDADATHIPQDLIRRLFEGKKQAGFSAGASGVRQMRSHAALACSSGSTHQNAASAVKAAAFEHLVQAGDPGRDSFVGNLMA